MPFAVVLSLLSLLTPALPAKKEASITLQKTESVAALLKDLSVMGDMSLTTSESRGKEVLIVGVKDVPLSDLMKQVAWATYGKWEEASSGGYRLVRDDGAAVAAERKYAKWQAKEAALAIEHIRSRILEKKLPPEKLASQPYWVNQSSTVTPVQRAAARALAFVRPETIIFNKPDAKAVYSNDPTPAQFAFNGDISGVIRAYNSEVEGRRPVVRVVMDCDYTFELGTAHIRMFDAQNGYVDGENLQFKLYDTLGNARPSEFADEIPPEAQVQLSAASRFFVRPLEGWWDWPSDDLLGKIPDVVSRLRQPEKFDPMESLATDAWLTVGNMNHRNVVANVDDAYMAPGWARQVPKLGVAFRQAGGYNAELQPDWLLARPSLPTPPWQHRIDRGALGKLVRAKAVGPLDMFSAISDYSASTAVAPDPFVSSQYMAWAGVFETIDLRQWPTARLFGELTGGQRKDLIEGRRVAISDIPPMARRALLSPLSPVDGNASGNDLTHELSVRFPNGLPTQGWLKASLFDQTQVAFSAASNDSNAWDRMPIVAAQAYVDKVKRNDPERYKNLQIVFMLHAGLDIEVMTPPDAESTQLAYVLQQSPVTYHAPMRWADAPAEIKQRVLVASRNASR